MGTGVAVVLYDRDCNAARTGAPQCNNITAVSTDAFIFDRLFRDNPVVPNMIRSWLKPENVRLIMTNAEQRLAVFTADYAFLCGS